MADQNVIKVPDIGGANGVEVIEISVSPGDTVAIDDPLFTVESDKATMEIPSPVAGVLVAFKIALGDKVSEGDEVAVIESAASGEAAAEPAEESTNSPEPENSPERNESLEQGKSPQEEPAPKPQAVLETSSPIVPSPNNGNGDSDDVYASPSVRRLARELGVDLKEGGLTGSGPRQRLTKDDVHAYVKSKMTGVSPGSASGGDVPEALSGLLPWPKVDFARFGPVEREPLSRVRKISGPALHRNWVTIPHVTNHEEADITDLECFRQQLNADRPDNKVTLLALLMKACAVALKAFPQVNASLDGDHLILKHYCHIGFAADTPQGLLVPVVRDADKKGVYQIAADIRTLSASAREGKLKPDDMQGGSFSISSLGGIGGTHFTPIINAPEVAILGVGKARERLQRENGEIVDRLILPLSLSWDHRAIDGALAGKFNAHLAAVLADYRRAIL